jgi:hypothetical protein
MHIHDTLGHIDLLLLGRLSDMFDLSLDTWFKIAAVLILWVYVILAPGNDAVES